MKLWIAALAALSIAVPPAYALELDGKARQAMSIDGVWSDALPDPQGASGIVRGAVDIAAPPELVWRVLLDCRTARRMVVSLTACKVLEGSVAAGMDVREHITRGNLVIPPVRNVFRSDYEPHRRIRFRRVSGDLKVMQGEWRLHPIAGGTRVTYENRVAADLAVPAALIRSAMKRDTRKALLALRREALAAQ